MTSGRTNVSQTVSSTERRGGCNGGRGVSGIPFLTTVQFLRLVQPVDEASLPILRVAIKGQEYTFPFTFVIPERLLPAACNHTVAVENQSVEEAHLRLPPSLGDRTVSTIEDKDDLAPDMARISYAIRVRVLWKKDAEGKSAVLADTTHKIAVSPSLPDAPPIHIEDKSKEYVFRKEKDLRKGFLGKKIGRASIFAEQPQPLRIIPNSSCPASTRVPVSLNFIPANNETSPPELGNMTAKVRTSTFFSTQRTAYIPTVSRSTPDPFIGMYQECTLLSSRCVSNVRWDKQAPTGSSTSSKAIYKAQIVVPIAEPKCKHLVPSFSTCFVTRSYALELSLSVRTSNHSQLHLTLKLPLQVSQPANDALEYDSAPQDTSVDEFFVPRIILPSTLQQEAAIMPPPAFEGPAIAGQLPPSMLVRLRTPCHRQDTLSSAVPVDRQS